MSCSKTKKLIPLFPNDLEPGESALVTEHVAACPLCAAELGMFVAQAARFQQVREGRSTRVDLWAGIQSKLAQPALAPVTSFALLTRGRAVAAAAAVLALVGLFAWSNRSGAPTEPTTNVAVKAPTAPLTVPVVTPAPKKAEQPVVAHHRKQRHGPTFFDESASPVKLAKEVELLPLDEEADVPSGNKRFSHSESTPEPRPGTGSGGSGAGEDRSLSF
jgi:hypothetical protein